MVIEREINGEIIEVKLTSEELRKAYLEQEHLYDVADVKSHLKSGIYDDDDNEVVFTDDEVDDIVDRVRCDMNKHDTPLDTAIDEAIGEAIKGKPLANWILDDAGYHCSSCGTVAGTDSATLNHYCPQCGAIMLNVSTNGGENND